MINLNDYKNLKKLQLMQKEILEINKIITDFIEKLKNYKRYIPVNESISALHNSRTILEIHLNKIKRAIETSDD